MFKEFFHDDKERLSMQRLTTFLLVVTAIVLAGSCIWFIIIGKLITDIVYLVGVLLGFATGSKVWSKFAESKETKE